MDADDEIRVLYPHGGHHFLLHWFTPHDRGRLVVARSREAVERTFARIVQEHGAITIMAYVEADLVAPSARMRRARAATVRQGRMARFWGYLAHTAKEYFDVYSAWPEGLEACATYEPRDVDPEDPPDEWSVERHYQCVRCEHCVRPVGLTKDAFYDRHGAAFRAQEAQDDLRQHSLDAACKYPRVLSRAPEATDDEMLSVAMASCSPHSDGGYLLDMDDTTTWLPSDILLFYRKIADVDPTALQTMIVASEAAHRARDAAREVERTRRDEIEQGRRLKRLRDLLG